MKQKGKKKIIQKMVQIKMEIQEEPFHDLKRTPMGGIVGLQDVPGEAVLITAYLPPEEPFVSKRAELLVSIPVLKLLGDMIQERLKGEDYAVDEGKD